MTDLLNDFIDASRARVAQALDLRLPADHAHPARLHQAMRYSVLNGGKRLRPMLVYATGQVLGLDPDTLAAPACALEMIHVYSLIHDDLPAMDDDDLRRGKPTCHKAFDQATAILAGDALQALAFKVLAEDATLKVSADIRVKMIALLATAAGAHGMVGGQAIDLAAVGQQLTLPELENMHIHKTGALIRACVNLASLARPDLSGDHYQRLDHYAKCIGLAFQVQDDILDEESDTATLGKTQGKDRDHDKPTYPALLGLSAAKEKARELDREAQDSLSVFGADADVLRALSRYIIQRAY